MHSHVAMMALFAFFVSLIFAVLSKDAPREQARVGGLMFLGFMLTGLAVSWLMYPFPLR